jgi:glutathione peroxidase
MSNPFFTPSSSSHSQDPGTDEEIVEFCTRNFGVSFPMMKKVDVNGSGEHEVFAFLKKALPGSLGLKVIKWNFTKFLIGRDGVPIKRYSPTDKPEDIAKDIEKALAAPANL